VPQGRKKDVSFGGATRDLRGVEIKYRNLPKGAFGDFERVDSTPLAAGGSMSSLSLLKGVPERGAGVSMA